MHSLLVIQLSDVHCRNTDDQIFSKWQCLCKAVRAEITPEIKVCVIAFCGDAAFAGKTEEFEVAELLLNELRDKIQEFKQDMEVHILTVPGNHDCSLVETDEIARVSVREKTDSTLPESSVSEYMLKVQDNYFGFSTAVSGNDLCFSLDRPFYTCCDISVGGDCVRFHMLNSSWTSTLAEREDLRYPLSEFDPPSTPEAKLCITMIHHPLHWFRMPDIRTQLRGKINSNTDLLLTGHEHETEMCRRHIEGVGDVNTIEGGVLQEDGVVAKCSFNLINIDLKFLTQKTKCYQWAAGHFEPVSEDVPEIQVKNPYRVDKKFRLNESFEKWLDVVDMPLVHPRVNDLHLSDLFEYPDLRKFTNITKSKKGGKTNDLVTRIKSGGVVDELLEQQQVLITGSDRSGKSSFVKKLYSEFLARKMVPVFVDGSVINNSCSESKFRRIVGDSIRKQYRTMTPSEYDQIDGVERILIIDDIHLGPTSPSTRRLLLDYASSCFDKIFVMASDDFYFELANHPGEDAADLLSYQRYEICHFGHQRLEALTIKWISLGMSEYDPVEIQHRAYEACQKIQSILGLAGVPHTPWLLLVVLNQALEDERVEIAARNGDIGFLYQSVIGAALFRSKIREFDLPGKFAYLSELAYLLHASANSKIQESKLREFHLEHCRKYQIYFDYEKVVEDFVQTQILRRDDDEIAFCSKWVYCYFVAKWLDRNLNREEMKPVAVELLEKLSSQLYHEISANIIVFLAHLSDDRLVINSMRKAASKMFASAPVTEMSSDIKTINSIGHKGGYFRLPKTPPDFNRKMMQDERDELKVKNLDYSYGGRSMQIVPDEAKAIDSPEGVLNEIRAAIKTIRILGQVLRNGASSIEGDEKVGIMSEILWLGRRLLGWIYESQVKNSSVPTYLKHRAFRYIVASYVEDNHPDIDPNDAEGVHIGRTILRDLRRQADDMANQFRFGITWLASFAMIKRMSESIGLKLLDTTLNEICRNENVLPNTLVKISVDINRRKKNLSTIVDDMCKLHDRLAKDDNRLARVVLEALTWERLMLYETEYMQSQKLCQKMGIEVPVKSLDSSVKKFK